ncbi:MAG: hypothetical protein IIX61_06570 [Loktanella sp.]|nr:hypothetical protein [Loktanella sp.]
MTTSRDQELVDYPLVFARFSTGLSEISKIVRRLEQVIVPTIEEQGIPELLTGSLQDFDLALQSLDGLAELAASIGHSGYALTEAEYATFVLQLRLGWLRSVTGAGTMPVTTGQEEVAIF